MSYLREHDEHVRAAGGYSADIISVTSFLGTIEVEQCTTCGYYHVRCLHENNTWHDTDGQPLPSSRVMEGQHLYCDLCGSEGT